MSESAEDQQFIIGLDLGQSQDYTALAIVERVPVADGGVVAPHRSRRSQDQYHLRYLERPPLGTLYTTIVERVRELLATPPLGPKTPLVVDKTGVGAAVLDMFGAAGLRPYAVTITGGETVVQDGARHAKVPKRDLVGLLVALFQGGRLKVARDLELAPLLLNELLNFKLKVNVQTGHDSYEAWRESIHDDLVLAVALACWHAQNAAQLPFGWLRNNPAFRRQVLAGGDIACSTASTPGTAPSLSLSAADPLEQAQQLWVDRASGKLWTESGTQG